VLSQVLPPAADFLARKQRGMLRRDTSLNLYLGKFLAANQLSAEQLFLYLLTG
jgi:hypothetical protein